MKVNFSKQVQSVIILLIIFAVMFALNSLMPLHRDDYDYSMIWKTGEHLNSLSDVFESTYIHYFEHGGRAFTVFCLILFLWLGKFIFDVANALMFTALIVLIYLHTRREIKFEDFGVAVHTTFRRSCSLEKRLDGLSLVGSTCGVIFITVQFDFGADEKFRQLKDFCACDVFIGDNCGLFGRKFGCYGNGTFSGNIFLRAESKIFPNVDACRNFR